MNGNVREQVDQTQLEKDSLAASFTFLTARGCRKRTGLDLVENVYYLGQKILRTNEFVKSFLREFRTRFSSAIWDAPAVLRPETMECVR